MRGALIEFEPAARAEFDEASRWYLARNPEAAAALVAEVEWALDAISRTPGTWPVHRLGTRRLVLPQFPFSVIYRSLGIRVRVIALAHGKRRPGYWRDR